MVQMAINNTFHSTLGDTPTSSSMARIGDYPTNYWTKVPGPHTPMTTSAEPLEKSRIYRIARRHLQFERDRIIRQQHKLSRRKDVTAGVLVFHLASERSAPIPKLSHRFDGPYRVLQVRHNKALCRSLLTCSQSWFHFDTLKLASKHYEDEFFSDQPS